jgi:hypothetical protein
MPSQDKQATDAQATCCHAGAPALGDVLAASALVDVAEARWLAFAIAEYGRGRADAQAEAGDAFAAGYARCAADVKRAEHALAEHLAAEVAAERGRWIVRGEVRTRATFGAPHADDYRGGPVAALSPEALAELLAELVARHAAAERESRRRDAEARRQLGRAA